MDEALEIEIVLDPERDRHAAHPDAGHRAVADVDEIDAGRLEETSRFDRPLDADRARWVDLDGDHPAAIGELAKEPCRRRCLPHGLAGDLERRGSRPGVATDDGTDRRRRRL